MENTLNFILLLRYPLRIDSIAVLLPVWIYFADKVGTAESFEQRYYGFAVFFFISEKEGVLKFLFFRGFSGEYGFKRVGMDSGIIDDRSYGHRCRREILHLFETEIQGFGFGCEFRHIFRPASSAEE